MSRVRTRFAPSPTGDLHLGNVRVAAFNWLFARRHDGDFVLRIEDTDVDRSRAGAEEGILRDLRWLGLAWDEGPDVGGPAGPYRQSESPERYREVARSLVEADHAYPCYCTPDELEAEAVSVGEGSDVLRYSGRCRELDEDERRAREAEGRSPAIRLRVPLDAEVEFEDEVRGSISFPARDFGDFVILRSDGRPTYNFAVVLDDARMEISHVIRGAGHLSNTPKQALLYDALGAPRPHFAHLPMVLSPGGGKLSKREGAAAVSDLRAMDLDALTEAVRPHLDRDRFELDGRELRRALELLRERMGAFGDVNELLELIHPTAERLRDARARLQEDAGARSVLTAVRKRVASLDAWEEDAMGAAVRRGGEDVGGRALYHPVRRALTGVTSGPSLGGVMAALGPSETLARLDRAAGAEEV